MKVGVVLPSSWRKMTDPAAPFAIAITTKPWNRHSFAFHNCDVECALCGRPIKNRMTCKVVIHTGQNEAGEHVFLPIKGAPVGKADPVEWGSFIGSHCAKKLPKTHKVGMKAACKNWEKWG